MSLLFLFVLTSSGCIYTIPRHPHLHLPWRHPTTATRLQMSFSHNMYFSCTSQIIVFVTMSTIWINWTKFHCTRGYCAPSNLIFPCNECIDYTMHVKRNIYTHTLLTFFNVNISQN